jgi:hypothetical protein
VSTGTAVYETTDAKVTYTYQLGPDETYKVTVNYASTGKPAEVEWDMAYLHANLIAGRAWFGETGSQVARFKITYSDGIFYEIRILYGTQICDFNDLRGGLQTTSVWKGTDSVGQNVAVRRWAWKTPARICPFSPRRLHRTIPRRPRYSSALPRLSAPCTQCPRRYAR